MKVPQVVVSGEDVESEEEAEPEWNSAAPAVVTFGEAPESDEGLFYISGRSKVTSLNCCTIPYRIWEHGQPELFRKLYRRSAGRGSCCCVGPNYFTAEEISQIGPCGCKATQGKEQEPEAEHFRKVFNPGDSTERAEV